MFGDHVFFFFFINFLFGQNAAVRGKVQQLRTNLKVVFCFFFFKSVTVIHSKEAVFFVPSALNDFVLPVYGLRIKIIYDKFVYGVHLFAVYRNTVYVPEQKVFFYYSFYNKRALLPWSYLYSRTTLRFSHSATRKNECVMYPVSTRGYVKFHSENHQDNEQRIETIVRDCNDSAVTLNFFTNRETVRELFTQ